MSRCETRTSREPTWMDGSRSSTSGRREQIGIRAFVVNLLFVTMGLFIGLVLLDLINILTVTHASAHVAGKVFLRVALAGADPLVLIRISPANAKKKEPTSGLEPLTPAHYELACPRTSPYWCVRILRLFRG